MTHEVRARNGDNRFYVILKDSVKSLSGFPAKFRPNLLQPNRALPCHVQGILPISCCVARGNQHSSPEQLVSLRSSQVLLFCELVVVNGRI